MLKIQMNKAPCLKNLEIRVLNLFRYSIFGFRILILFFIFYFLFSIFPTKAQAAASLSLFPSTKTVEVDQEFEVGVVLNTGGSNTDAADVILNYDATKLTLVTATLGNLYEQKLTTNTSISGKVTLRAASASGSYFNGTGTFATLTFKGKAVGTAIVYFDFITNSTTDCNVAYAGSDILRSVTNGSYTVVAPGTLPTSTPGPTGTVTPRPTQPVTGIFDWTVGLGIVGLFFLLLGSLAIIF